MLKDIFGGVKRLSPEEKAAMEVSMETKNMIQEVEANRIAAAVNIANVVVGQAEDGTEVANVDLKPVRKKAVRKSTETI